MRRAVIAGNAEAAFGRAALQSLQAVVHLVDEAHAAQLAVRDHVDAGLDLIGDGDPGGVIEGFLDVGRASGEDAVLRDELRVGSPAARGPWTSVV